MKSTEQSYILRFVDKDQVFGLVGKHRGMMRRFERIVKLTEQMCAVDVDMEDQEEECSRFGGGRRVVDRIGDASIAELELISLVNEAGVIKDIKRMLKQFLKFPQFSQSSLDADML